MSLNRCRYSISLSEDWSKHFRPRAAPPPGYEMLGTIRVGSVTAAFMRRRLDGAYFMGNAPGSLHKLVTRKVESAIPALAGAA